MTVRDDAIFLAGFLVGTYDLKGESQAPAVLQPFIKRILESSENMSAVTRKIGHVTIETTENTDLKTHLENIEAKENTAPVDDMSKKQGKIDTSEDENSKIEYDQIMPKIRPYANINDAGDVTVVIPEKKPRKPWSEESREKARQNAIARGLGKKKTDSGGIVLPEPVSLPEVREPQLEGILSDDDWPDIQRMRRNGLPDVRIASSFDVELDYFLRFSDRMREQDARQGNG